GIRDIETRLGKDEDWLDKPKPKAPIMAWWMGKKLAPIDDIPMADRPWEKDKARLSPQLAHEFVTRFMKAPA
ncbi:MAG: hypothetical protein ACPHW5_03805, partial [Candidatus Puniceispirillales bacterium]